MQWRKQYFAWGVRQLLPFDIVSPYTELTPLWSVPPMIACRGVSAVPKAKTRKLDKAALVTHQEGHHFEISDNFPNVFFLFQGIWQDLDTAVFLFEMRRVS